MLAGLTLCSVEAFLPDISYGASFSALREQQGAYAHSLFFSRIFAAQFAVTPSVAPSVTPATLIVEEEPGGIFRLRHDGMVFAGSGCAVCAVGVYNFVHIVPAAAVQQSVNSQSPAGTAAIPAGTVMAAPAASGIRLMGTVEFRGELKNLPKWEQVLKKEQSSPTFGGKKDLSKLMRPALYQQWQNIVEAAQKQSLLDKAKAVNSFFNRWPYRTDWEVYGVEDYWATPEEFMKKSGDCEDYSMTKYFALKFLGVPPESMRILVVIETIRNIGHAILALYVDDKAYILDNLSDLLLTHDRYSNYKPQYSVNEFYRWAHIMPVKKPGTK